jgi:hypothetical protein
MATKNLGQVSGVHIGSTPPSNTILIWYDSTPSQLRHKVYDPTLKQWVVLDQNIISAITYSELTNMAKNSGLSVGEYFQITDRSNALALAITSTKVQYCDALGNILIDDLGTNIQYHVTSSNLQIDDVVGVFDETNRKLVFQFNEQTPDFTADDYVLGKVQRNNIWSLAKYKLSSFLSKVTGNSITWNGGFFFSFSDALKNVLDKAGGVVSKTTYDRDKEQLTTSINNVGKENQNIIQNAHNELTEATKPDSFYGTQLPSIATGGEPTDIAKGDTLLNIVSKIQRYINKFKYAVGIRISKEFSTEVEGKVNNNDTVESAIAKLQKQHDSIKLNLPQDWQYASERLSRVLEGDSYDVAIGKIEAWRVPAINLEQDWVIVNLYSSSQDLIGTAQYRIRNALLEIKSTQNYKIPIKYSNRVDDYFQNVFIDLNEVQINQIRPFIDEMRTSYDAYEAGLLKFIGVSASRRGYSNQDTSVTEVLKKIALFEYHLGCCSNPANMTTLGIIFKVLAGVDMINLESDPALSTTCTTDEQLVPIRYLSTYSSGTLKGGIDLILPMFHVTYRLW